LVKKDQNKEGGSTAVNTPSMQFAIRALSLSFAAILVAPALHAQDVTGVNGLNQRQTLQRMMGDESLESAAYKAFYDVKPEDADKKIQLGNEFLSKYPKSPFVPAVDVGLTNAYYAKQDWKDFYTAADKALALTPDNIDVLMTVGWVIPHFYNPDDADAEKQLDKAESYEKRAIETMAAMAKPASMSDAQFTQFKAQKAVQAHSALGLVYFRREDYANSLTELQQATQNNANPDQTDLFVLGMDLQNLNKFADAADAFGRCVQIVGNLQDRCKQNADMARKQAAQPK
jgi:tetratricopeptide (TPR) repeat protein